MFNKIKNKIILVVVVIMIANPLLAYAQAAGGTIIQPQDVSVQAGANDLPDYSQSGVDQTIKEYLCTPSDTPTGNDLANCINKLYRFGIAIGAIALVFFLVMGGYLYIVGGETGKQKAKAVIMNALVGMAILLSSFLLLGFINPDLTVFKPINPPVFIDPGLPSCEDLGYTDDCTITLPNGEKQILPGGGGGKGEKVACPDSKLVSTTSLGLPGSSNQICKAFGEKLLIAFNSMKPTSWVITSTVTGTHSSSCHSTGNEYSGTCADIDFTGNDSSNADSWNKLCRALKSAGVYPHNEVGHDGDQGRALRDKLSDCGSYNAEKNATRDHIHSMWRTGTGGGGGTSPPPGSGGSRPNCKSVSGVPGACDDGLSSGNRYKSGDWSNTDAALRTAFDNLKKKNSSIEVDQVYRSPEYSAHLRSSFEASALMNGWSDDQLSKHGQYCQSTGIKYVTKSDVSKYDTAAKNYVNTHFGHHFNSFQSPTTCKSDHGSGIGFDLKNKSKPTSAFIQDARGVGLCPDVPHGTLPSGKTMNPDYPHWALFSKIPGGQSSCVSY